MMCSSMQDVLIMKYCFLVINQKFVTYVLNIRQLH
jgi:hypothetical protein